MNFMIDIILLPAATLTQPLKSNSLLLYIVSIFTELNPLPYDPVSHTFKLYFRD